MKKEEGKKSLFFWKEGRKEGCHKRVVGRELKITKGEREFITRYQEGGRVEESFLEG